MIKVMYEFAERNRQLFDLLEDEVSKELFKARMLFDIEPSMTNAMRILRLNEASRGDPELMAKRSTWKEDLKLLMGGGTNKRLILYGLGLGGPWVADLLQYEKIDFYGFCDRRADSYPDGFKGKPVISPKYLFEHADEFYVINTVGETSFDSVMRDLEANHFPMDHVLDHFSFDRSLVEKQYFDFPELYHEGTAFVDAGCFDCTTDIIFSKWCKGKYSKIFAFEPDPDNFTRCLSKGKGIHDLEVIQAGLADRPGTAEFLAKGIPSSSLCVPGRDATAAQSVTVQITTIDEVVCDEQVGMIKMDIEGMELAALRGAEKTLQRDRPLLAISAYHRPGDIPALMNYLNKTVPEYHFWLRHYTGPVILETVLYASVDRP